MGQYLDDLWNDLEQTWDLAMKVNDLSETERGDPNQAWSCLLYTSPSPRDATLSRMPSSA